MPQTANPIAQLLPMIIFFIALYFFIIYPQKKREKKFKEMLAKLKVGDDIITIGGIIGKVFNIKDDVVTIEVGQDKTKLKIEKTAIKNITTIEN